MRIPKEQLTFIKDNIKKIAPDAKVYVFGSRVDNSKHGGDIDILVLTTQLLTFEQKSEVTIAFIKKFGEQKLDLVNYIFKDDAVFKKLILLDAVEI